MGRYLGLAILIVACGDPKDSSAPVDAVSRVTVSAPDAPDAIIAIRAADDDSWTTHLGSEAPIMFNAVDRYTVAMGCVLTNEVVVYELTVGELTALTSDLQCAAPPASRVTVSGNVIYDSSIPILEVGIMSERTRLDSDSSPTSFAITAPSGTHDLVVAASGQGTGGGSTRQIAIVHDVALAADSTIDVDVGTNLVHAAFPPPFTATFNTLVTARHTWFELSYSRYADYSYLAELGPEDRQVVRGASTGGVSVQLVARVPTLPSSGLTPPSDTPSFDTDHVAWTSQPGAVAYRIGGASSHFAMFASPGAFDPVQTVTVPALSTIPGWTFDAVVPTAVAAITGNPSLADAIQFVPRNDTLSYWMSSLSVASSK